MEQLLFSGGLRLIHSRKAVDGILEYDLKNDDLDIDVNTLREIYLHHTESRRALLNQMDLDADKKTMTIEQLRSGPKNYLLRTDMAFLGNYYNELKTFKAIVTLVKNREIKLMDKAGSLIQLLKKEYHLD